jgi:UrcA family protein
MYTKLLLAGAVLLFACDAATADDQNVSVAIHVSAAGLDLSRPSDARVFYARIKDAAWTACTRGNRVNLRPVDNVNRCVEQSLAAAIRSTRLPLLTQTYLATHTPEEAALYGVDKPNRIAGVAEQ